MKKIITYGTFDLFHLGHLRILERAKSLGDYLVVAVSSDEFNAIKGKKCVYPFEHRKQIVEAIKYVDEVIREDTWGQKKSDILKHKIDALVMGGDWQGKFDELVEVCEVLYLARTDGISTTQIKHKIKNKKDK
jgi:glycerol-3-phosphate cytidylyltransferase